MDRAQLLLGILIFLTATTICAALFDRLGLGSVVGSSRSASPTIRSPRRRDEALPANAEEPRALARKDHNGKRLRDSKRTVCKNA